MKNGDIMSGEQLARGLGWFSLGLGAIEVVAPRWLARQIGVRDSHTRLLQLLGIREIVSGVGILTGRRTFEFVESRVAGDVLDMAMLGAAFQSQSANTKRLLAATAMVAGVTALGICSSQQLRRSSGPRTRGRTVQITQAIIIDRTPEELYTFWRDFENLPRFMKHVESIQTARDQGMTTTAGTARSHWVVKAPGGTVEWDAAITEDRPNELIAWRSVDGADVANSGVVRFKPTAGARGTIVEVEITYDPPGGRIGIGVAKLFGEDPQWQVKDDLRRFKQVMEAGEVITTEGQPAGRESGTSRKYDSAVRERSVSMVTGARTTISVTGKGER